MSLLAHYNSPVDIMSTFLDDFYTVRRNIYPSRFVNQKRAKFVPINDKLTNLEIELPGYKKDQIQVYSENGSLVVSAKNDSEHSQRSYNYSFLIEDNQKIDRIKYESGILTVEIVKIVPDGHKRINYKIE